MTERDVEVLAEALVDVADLTQRAEIVEVAIQIEGPLTSGPAADRVRQLLGQQPGEEV